MLNTNRKICNITSMKISIFKLYKIGVLKCELHNITLKKNFI